MFSCRGARSPPRAHETTPIHRNGELICEVHTREEQRGTTRARFSVMDVEWRLRRPEHTQYSVVEVDRSAGILWE